MKKIVKTEENIDKMKGLYSYLTGDCGMTSVDIEIEKLVEVMSDKDFTKLLKRLEKPTFRYNNSWEFEEGMKSIFEDLTEDYMIGWSYQKYYDKVITDRRDMKLAKLGI
jgi:hypothetical protein